MLIFIRIYKYEHVDMYMYMYTYMGLGFRILEERSANKLNFNLNSNEAKLLEDAHFEK